MRPPLRPDPATLPGVDVRELGDPFARFALWWAEAVADPLVGEPAAMTLASVDVDGRPSARVVLLRAFDERGFVFYTNLESRKGRELLARPACALCMHHQRHHRQVRIEGDAVVVDDVEADAYFQTRPRDSRVSAWASDQSRPLGSEQLLEERIAMFTARFGEGVIPRPPFWSGFRVVPRTIELWQEGPFRRHRRDCYVRTDGGWQRTLLFP
ncbi:MAG: pyridoxamine 5'-phosphate oxidase [Deltaproteobacteria bacterium]|nr:pyridoxamine 5'-phosphate oxidase [Deltaproteobacteria bacterium]